jgi:hypothetical protein
MSAPDVKQVIERHRAALLALPTAHSVAYGISPRDSARRILVYGTSPTPPSNLPASLEGFEVEWVTSAPFRAR